MKTPLDFEKENKTPKIYIYGTNLPLSITLQIQDHVFTSSSPEESAWQAQASGALCVRSCQPDMLRRHE